MSEATSESRSLVLVPQTAVTPNQNIVAITAQIVAAHVSHNKISADELPALIRNVYASLANASSAAIVIKLPPPAVPIKQSITPNHIICLECGAHMSMIKRHLATSHNLTPREYLKRWSLPPTYPMLAPNYSKARSRIAKEIGLGHQGGRRKRR